MVWCSQTHTPTVHGVVFSETHTPTVHSVVFSETHTYYTWCGVLRHIQLQFSTGFHGHKESLPTVHTWAGTVQDYTHTADTTQQQT